MQHDKRKLIIKHKGAKRIKQVLKAPYRLMGQVKRAPKDKTLLTLQALVLFTFSVPEKK